MLYDPNWQKPTDVFSLESLIAWLEKQPADKTYSFCRPSSCLIAEYLKQNGVEEFSLTSNEVIDLGWIEIVNPRYLPFVETYGAALERARVVNAASAAS